MLTRNNSIKCDYCGKFIGYKDHSYSRFYQELVRDSDGAPCDVDDCQDNYHANCFEKYINRYKTPDTNWDRFIDSFTEYPKELL